MSNEPASNSPGNDLSSVTGLEPGGGVPPGETPPATGSVTGASGGSQEHVPNMGPVSGNRTPMIVTLVVLGLIVLGCAGMVVASLVAS